MFTTICLFDMFNYLHVYITAKKKFNLALCMGRETAKSLKTFLRGSLYK